MDEDILEALRLCALARQNEPREPALSPPAPKVSHNNLPRQLSSFIGREKECGEIKEALASSPLLTLLGSGGVGKTRLALQVAEDLLDNYSDGVWLVELAALIDPTLVPQTVASGLELQEQPGQPLIQTLLDNLKSRHLLLVLDNCEHLVDACASLAETLLKACSHLTILATSREPLGVHGEQSLRVPSLSLPDPHSLCSDNLNQSEAVRLFRERARLVKSDFAVTDQNAATVAQICHRLDGIPLAIELAAARVGSLPVEQIEARLHERFRLLIGGNRAALPRQQTLLALIEWSYELLSQVEKKLLCHLSVFAGGWSLEAAENVCTDEDIDNTAILDLLAALVNKSLVVYVEQQEEARYRLLETVRQYAADRLEECGNGETLRQRHQQFFLTLAEESETQMLGPVQAVWMDRLEREHDNLRVALNWRDHYASLRLAGALWRFWQVRGHVREGRARLSSVLVATDVLSRTSARAKALFGAGVLGYLQGDNTLARAWNEEALACYKSVDNEPAMAHVLCNLGAIALQQGDYTVAQTLLTDSLALRCSLGGDYVKSFL